MYGYELSNECDKPIAKATPEKLEVSCFRFRAPSIRKRTFSASANAFAQVGIFRQQKMSVFRTAPACQSSWLNETSPSSM